MLLLPLLVLNTNHYLWSQQTRRQLSTPRAILAFRKRPGGRCGRERLLLLLLLLLLPTPLLIRTLSILILPMILLMLPTGPKNNRLMA